MARPRPDRPASRADARSPVQNRWNTRSTSPTAIPGPWSITEAQTISSSRPTETRTVPPPAETRMALLRRFATARRRATASPTTSRPAIRSWSSTTPDREAAAAKSSTVSPTTAPTSMGSRRLSGRSWWAYSSRSSTRADMRSAARRDTRPAARKSSGPASGSAITTSRFVRSTANGLRSSCDASCTNRRWPSKASSSRSSISSKVSARSRSSSDEPPNSIRRDRSVAVISRATAEIRPMGRRTRPATYQPTARLPRNTPARAVNE